MKTDDSLAGMSRRALGAWAVRGGTALAAGLLGGLALAFAAPQALPAVLGVVEPVGDLWLRALKATSVPLVAALLFTGIVQTVATAPAGAGFDPTWFGERY